MPSLRVLSHTVTPKPIEAAQTVLCSRHELIAIVTYAHDVFVYRLNGQVAFIIRNQQDEDDIAGGEEPLRVTSACWSPDGRRLVVAWNDGTWKIHEAEKGEAIFDSTVRDATDESDTSAVTGLSWERYESEHDKKHEEDPEVAPLAGSLKNEASDFLKAVTLLDTTAVLPRLSALPSHGLRSNAESVRFATQVATDGVFAAAQQKLEQDAEVLLLQTSHSIIQVMLNGTSHIGSARCAPHSQRTQFCSIASSAICVSSGNPQVLELLEIPVTKLNSTTLQLTSHSITQLTALAQYVRRTVQCINHDYTTGIATPGRFTKNISMTLDDNTASNSTLVSTLLQLCLTGQIHSDLLEWLTDIVKDAGLKRWDKDINAMHASVQLHLHSHILPALDRISIAASKLRGLARFHQGSAAFEPDEKSFTKILDAVHGLRSTTLQTLEISIKEWGLWRTFARAMKTWIEVATAGPNSKEAIETEERENLGLDHYAVMQYIETVIQHGSQLGHAINGPKAQNLGVLVNEIEQAIQLVLESVTNWQSRMFSSTREWPLDATLRRVLDSCATQSLKDAGLTIVRLLTLTEDRVLRLEHGDIVSSADMARGNSPPAVIWTMEDVIDAKLYDDCQRILYAQAETIEDNSVVKIVSVDLSTFQETVLHEVQENSATGVERLLVSGRRSKEFCVLVGRSSRSWTVLDLHSVGDE